MRPSIARAVTPLGVLCCLAVGSPARSEVITVSTNFLTRTGDPVGPNANLYFGVGATANNTPPPNLTTNFYITLNGQANPNTSVGTAPTTIPLFNSSYAFTPPPGAGSSVAVGSPLAIIMAVTVTDVDSSDSGVIYIGGSGTGGGSMTQSGAGYVPNWSVSGGVGSPATYSLLSGFANIPNVGFQQVGALPGNAGGGVFEGVLGGTVYRITVENLYTYNPSDTNPANGRYSISVTAVGPAATVPEPASVIVFGGLLSAGGVALRRRRTAAAGRALT